MYKVEELKDIAAKMQSFLEKKEGSEPNDIISRAENLGVLIAKSGNCLADAKYYQDQIINGAIMEAITKAYEEKLSPSTINKFVTTAAKESNYLVNLFDRINASATHQSMALNTILSYRKSEMKIL